jgi:hypothetical protein
MGKNGYLRNEHQRGPPWLLVKMVFFYLWVFFGIYGKNGIYFYGFGIIFDGRCLWCSNVYSIECRICGLRTF